MSTPTSPYVSVLNRPNYTDRNRIRTDLPMKHPLCGSREEMALLESLLEHTCELHARYAGFEREIQCRRYLGRVKTERIGWSTAYAVMYYAYWFGVPDAFLGSMRKPTAAEWKTVNKHDNVDQLEIFPL